MANWRFANLLEKGVYVDKESRGIHFYAKMGLKHRVTWLRFTREWLLSRVVSSRFAITITSGCVNLPFKSSAGKRPLNILLPEAASRR